MPSNQPIPSQCHRSTLTLPAHSGLVSPTYKGAGEGTAWLVWATPPSVFHSARFQVEHVLEAGKGHRRVSPGREAGLHPGSDPGVQLEHRVGVEEEILIQSLSDGVSTPAQRRLSSPYPLCLTLLQWEGFRQQGGNVTASQSLMGPGPGSPPRDVPL